MEIYTKDDFDKMDERFRTTFINSVWGFRNLNLIGTSSNVLQANFAIFNSLNHLGASPALATITIRPAEVERHTFENILTTNCFSANNVLTEIHQKAHQTSARYLKHENEADEVGLTTVWDSELNTPYLQESSIVLFLKYQEHHTLKINNTILLIASLEKIMFKNNCVEKDGFVNHTKAQTLSCVGIDAYYEPKFVEQLAYAKR
jgi:flavin reductase (DIM6/NTAB) family NADH-FMN oxidoreductase RutF